MTLSNLLTWCFIMATVTYLCRFITLVLVRKQITNKFMQSFLYYIPYSVLAIMVFPKIFFSTTHIISAIIGTLIALFLAFKKKSLLIVAIFSILTVFIVEQIIVFLA